MKMPKPLFLLQLLLLQLNLSSQVQWYQNQDGSNPPPYGTYASSVLSFNTSSFVACYQWQIFNDQYTWKVSRTNTAGVETKTFYVTGTVAGAEIRVKQNHSVYVLKRDYPSGMDPVFTVYRLNSNLEVQAERTISFPGNFVVISLNAFEIDGDGNVYLAGDGQYPDGQGGYGFASFVLKTSKNLTTKWSRMDSVQTSYARLHVDAEQKVTVIEDFYTDFPSIKVIRINAAGTQAVSSTIVPDAGRYSLFSSLDKSNNLLLYGGKMVNDTTQAIYFCKVSRSTGQVMYRKTQFTAPGSQLNDVKMDEQGRMFSLVTLYYPDKQISRISRLKPSSGQVIWNRSFNFSSDSCQLARLVMNGSEQFFAVGEKRCGNYFARGYAVRVKKGGQLNGNLPAPDSVAYQRYHTLVDGIIDNNQRLIAIGNTNDYDTTIYTSTYYRAFAARFNENCNDNNSNKAVVEEEQISAATANEEDAELVRERISLYPNPAQHQMVVSNMNPAEYDRLLIYNMQGAMILQQKVTGTSARLDLSNLVDGVYLLVFRSSAALKEKNIKFVVRK